MEYRIRPYYKSELAQAYAPDVCQKTALNRLATWIRTNKKLTEALRETDYRASQHMFTSRQVALIFEYLGVETICPSNAFSCFMGDRVTTCDTCDTCFLTFIYIICIIVFINIFSVYHIYVIKRVSQVSQVVTEILRFTQDNNKN